MPLEPGTMLGHYEIRSLIGVGGMGEVYRAHDHKLARDVALKVLPEAFARDPERIARFRREARLLAALNHNNIAAIYGFEEDNGKHFLVMELVEGDTLREQILREGAASAEEAVGIGRQMADALEHAHEKNIIHRDLKPANVKVTPAGVVKVLDFGLAKAFAAEPESGDPTDTPTLMSSPTLPGVILGTAAYMSPEQAKGKRVDKRTDIWALGCVLYELLTGQGAFSRQPSRHQSPDRKGGVPDRSKQPVAGAPGSDEPDTVQEIIARVLQADPDWNALPESTPPGIRALLRRCLTKDLNRRLRGAADISIALEDSLTAPATAPPAPAPLPAPPTPPFWKRTLPFALTSLLAAVLAALAVWQSRRSAPPGFTGPARLTVNLPPAEQLGDLNFPALAFSPDGTQLAYIGSHGDTQQIFLRSLDSQETKPIPGTEGAATPFFSPDGQWIGFFAQGKLKKVSIAGGFVQTLCDAASQNGGSWAADNTIFFAPSQATGLWKVSTSGGQPEEVTKLDRSKGQVSHRWPQVLPGGKALLFTVMTGLGLDENQIVTQTIGTGEQRVLVQGSTMARYSATGNLVYWRAGTLLALPFDPERLELTDTVPVSIAEEVLLNNGGPSAAQFALSATGSLAYLSGSAHQNERRLVWVDRKGAVEPVAAPPRSYRSLALSPDGRKVATEVTSNISDIWILDLARDAMTRTTSEPGGVRAPIWTPDGKRIVYRAIRSGFRNLFWRAVDGRGDEERLTASEENPSPTSVSPDGKALAFLNVSPTTGNDIWVLALADDPRQAGASPQQAGAEARKPKVFLRTPFSEGGAEFSPDGHWLAYRSNESGHDEIYVQPFPGPGGRTQISTDGGAGPRWARNGRELFYLNGDKMMVVEVNATITGFTATKPRVLFEGRYTGDNYDVAPDGQRFLMIQNVEPEQPATQINVILNWQKAVMSDK
ncbi:MAG: serine/threonine-protein kinase [Acidobacteria bacterium]|nr:serine/threonine-protein kinase [Acidobacteriota bacterium]